MTRQRLIIIKDGASTWIRDSLTLYHYPLRAFSSPSSSCIESLMVIQTSPSGTASQYPKKKSMRTAARLRISEGLKKRADSPMVVVEAAQASPSQSSAKPGGDKQGTVDKGREGQASVFDV